MSSKKIGFMELFSRDFRKIPYIASNPLPTVKVNSNCQKGSEFFIFLFIPFFALWLI